MSSSPPIVDRLGALPESERAQLVMRYPSWLDAPWLAVASQWEYTRVTISAGGLIDQFRGSGRRWAIAFLIDVGGPASVFVGTHPRVDLHGIEVTGRNTPQRFTMWEWGSMVQAQWYLFGAIAGTVWVVEQLLQ